MAFQSPFTITFHQQGVSPPLYIAGEFSDPPWEPSELDYTLDNEGEYIFTHKLSISSGQDYQYKFRCGSEQWLVDDSKPKAQDSSGNENNVIRASTHEQLVESKEIYDSPLKLGTAKSTEPLGSPGKVFNERGIVDDDDHVSSPSEATSPGVKDDSKATEKSEETNEPKPSEPDFRAPLFAHESFGAHEFVDDAMDHSQSESRRDSHASKSLATDAESTDLNDPTIEKFPSEKASVMDTLKKIQSSLDEDSVHIENASASPRTSSRRTSVDSTDEATYSLGSLSPHSPTASRKRGDRSSHGSFKQTRSAVSLGSIAEEPKPGDEDVARPRASSHSSSSDEDAVVMRQPKAKPTPEPEVVSTPHDEGDGSLSKNDTRTTEPATEPATESTTEFTTESTTEPIIESTTEATAEPTTNSEAYDNRQGSLTKDAKASIEEASSSQPTEANPLVDTKAPYSLTRGHNGVQPNAGTEGRRSPPPVNSASFLTWLRRKLGLESSSRVKRVVSTGIFAVVLGIAWWKVRGKKSGIPYIARRDGY